MTIPSIFRKISIHPFFYLFLVIVLMTGQFKVFVIFIAFLLFHEMGHILPALYYGWHIEKILLLPFGGITLFHERINRPLKEEFWIAIGGVLFQTFFYFLLCIWIEDPLLSSVHYGLLLFNLLPIFPLDGSKICLLFFQFFFSFKRSHLCMIFLSIIGVCTGFFLVRKNFILLLTFFFLSIRICKEWIYHPYLFEKFLLERYLYSFSFPKLKKINGVKEMKKDTYHYKMIGGKAIEEKEMLRIWFDKKR